MFWSSFTNLRSRLFKLPSACPQKYEILNLKFKRFGGLFAHLWIQIFDFIISRHLYIIIQIQDVDIKRADPSKKPEATNHEKRHLISYRYTGRNKMKNKKNIKSMFCEVSPRSPTSRRLFDCTATPNPRRIENCHPLFPHDQKRSDSK